MPIASTGGEGSGARRAPRGGLPARLAAGALTLLLCLELAVLVAKPVRDPDFFWHLKSGEWITEHRSLPRRDPFAYTTPAVLDPLQRYQLAYAWLSQVLFHLVFRAGGMAGLVALRVLLVGLLLAGAWRRRRGGRTTSACLLLLYLALLGRISPERPQFLSLVAFAWLLVILADLRREGDGPARGWVLSLVLLMTAWANLHAGVVLGQAVILLFLAVEGLKFAHPALRPLPGPRYRGLLLAGTGGLAASLVSPLTWNGRLLLGSAGETAPRNLEYLSAWRLFAEFNDAVVPVFGLFLLLAAAAPFLVRREDFDPAEAALAAAVGVFACLHARYIAFFPVAAFSLLGSAWGGARAGRPVRAALLVAAVVVAGTSAWSGRGNLVPRGSGPADPLQYPVAAADFIEREKPGGEMYNNLGWGGYLIWRLAPSRRVFIDGRIMSREAYRQALAIDAAAPGWEGVLDSWRVGYVVSPFFGSSGEVSPLVGALVQSPGWVPVFQRYNSVVFVREGEGNRDLVRRRAIPKAAFVAGLLATCDGLVASRPRDPVLRLARGDVLLRMNRLPEAREEYRQAVGLAPLNPLARRRLGFVERRLAAAGTGEAPRGK